MIGINSMICHRRLEPERRHRLRNSHQHRQSRAQRLDHAGPRAAAFAGHVSLPIGPELAQELGLPADYGILIVRVLPGGAADRAGLHGGNERAYLGNTPIMIGGDLIVAIDGEQSAISRTWPT